MTTKISEANIQATTLGALGGGGPKISSIIVTDSSYNNLDDTAVALGGGYIKLIGEDFAAGCQVLIGLTPVTSVTFVSDTEVRAQVPATAAGTYIVYLVNSDGGTAIRVNAITFSSTPTWVTGSSLVGLVNSAISIQLSASLAATYSLQAGSSLPAGVSLSSSGLISGTVTGISSETVYNFTVLATDAELQDSPRSFALAITLGDPYFMYNTLLLPSNGTNNSQNNTFLDSGTNNITVTRNGNTTQGTFTPYGSRWSNYFAANEQLTSASIGTNIGTGDFSIECWVYVTNAANSYAAPIQLNVSTGYNLYIQTHINTLRVLDYNNPNGSNFQLTGGTINNNTWYHLLLTRQSGTVRGFIDGKLTVNQTGVTANYGTAGTCLINAGLFASNISNARVILGNVPSAYQTSSTTNGTQIFTPSSTPLTAVTGTVLLTSQNNRFIDNSTNALTFTLTGSPKIQRFSPFVPGAAYSATDISGSSYFDGNGDYLDVASNAALGYGTGDFEISFWYYAISASGYLFDQRTTQPQVAVTIYYDSGSIAVYINGSIPITATDTAKNAWHYLTLSRVSGTTRLFIDGSQRGSNYTDSNNYGTLPLRIGCRYATISDIPYNGYMSDLRIIKGSGVSSQTVPTSPLTAVANTSLLLNYTNAGVIDNTMMHHVDTIASSKISTTQSKFGGASVYIDGVDDYLQIPASNFLDLGTSDFTIECWVYNETISTNYPSFIASITGWSAGASGHRFDNTGYANKFWFGLNGSGGVASGDPFMASTNTFNHNQWYHYAVTRSGNTWRMFVDGVLENTQTYSGSYNAALGGMRLGYSTWDGVQGWWKGYIDDLRITKGYARYTSNFTPPSSALLTQ